MRSFRRVGRSGLRRSVELADADRFVERAPRLLDPNAECPIVQIVGRDLLRPALANAGPDPVESGRVDAYVTDDIILYGLATKARERGSLVIVGRALSYAPYSIWDAR